MILTFVTRVWISLQRLGRREKGNFLKGIAAIAADQPRLPSLRQKRRWERERGRGREQRKTNCGGRCAPSAPLLHPIAPHPIVFIATCEPTALNSVRLLQRNDRRRDYTHPLPASPYQTFVPNFHLFYRLAPPTSFLTSLSSSSFVVVWIPPIPSFEIVEVNIGSEERVWIFYEAVERGMEY